MDGISLMSRYDVWEVAELINSVALPEDIFIKSSRDEVFKNLGKSLVYRSNGKIIAACLVNYNYIHTIVSSVPGTAKKLISTLTPGFYKTEISDLNDKSIKLFKSFGFKKVGETILCGYKRGRYEAIL